MAQPARRPADVLAAGAVVTRGDGDVLVVHRPKYDDWSFPKGKVDVGEHVTAAAVREVAEETGLQVRLGPPLKIQRYEIENGRRMKRVYYWVGNVVGDDDVSTYQANNEIDEVAWLPVSQARERLSHDRDRATLEEFRRFQRQTYPLLILRHSRARPRRTWTKDDVQRPLTRAGELQSQLLVPLLAAYGVTHLLTSSSRRCWTTVAPYAVAAGLEVDQADDLSEQEASADVVARHVQKLLGMKEGTVLCTHRPVLPWVFEALGLEPRQLTPGSVFVVHHRRGEVVATERHETTFR